MRTASGLTLAVTACLIPLQAGVIVTNLGSLSEPSSGTPIGQASTTSTYAKAEAFGMGNSDVNLTAAILRLKCSGNCSNLESIQVGIYADSNSAPAALVGDLTYGFSLPLSGEWASYTFTPPAPLVLSHDTVYWLLTRATIAGALVSGGSPMQWSYADSSYTAPTGPGATFLTTLTSSDDGATWFSTTHTNAFELDGDPVSGAAPEPGSIALAGLGLAAAAWLRRRRG